MIRESDYWAKKNNNHFISEEHVDKALQEKINRINLREEKLQELIDLGQLLIETSGEKVIF